MEITFILKGELEKLPPLLPRLIAISQRGIKTKLICTSAQQSSKDILAGVHIVCKETLHCERIAGKSSRIMDWMGFKKACKKIVQEECSNSDLFYVCSADTALCLNSFLKGRSYILQSNELYDRFPIYRYGIKKYAQKAKAMVVPEVCRANICMYWYDLHKKPYVIPNIPYVLSLSPNQYISDSTARQIVESFSGKKIVIYQGHIQMGDRSLTVIAEALKKKNDSDYILLLMGKNHNFSYEKLKEIYEETYHIPFVAAPYHLEITSHAHIALLSYDRISLNNIFCAPNKIYEYSGLGIPMLGNDIPGLAYTVEHEKMGVCTSYADVNGVLSAIDKIEENHLEFASNARAFFEKCDLCAMMERLCKDVLGEDCFER